MRTMPVRLLVAAAALAVVVLAGAGLIWWQAGAGTRAPDQPLAPGIIAGGSPIGGPFTLVDHTGREVTELTFRGKYLLIFFGFANCPDVCPLALDRFAQVLEHLGPDAANVQPLLISVDPERDTPAVLKGYVTAVDPRILGLTGTLEQVKAAASAYKVYFAKDPPDERGGYAVSHSSYEYLMGPDGVNRYVFRPEAEPERIAKLIRNELRG
jgi:protein SCO1/2